MESPRLTSSKPTRRSAGTRFRGKENPLDGSTREGSCRRQSSSVPIINQAANRIPGAVREVRVEPLSPECDLAQLEKLPAFLWRSSSTLRRPSSTRALTVLPSLAACLRTCSRSESGISTVVFIHLDVSFPPYCRQDRRRPSRILALSSGGLPGNRAAVSHLASLPCVSG